LCVANKSIEGFSAQFCGIWGISRSLVRTQNVVFRMIQLIAEEFGKDATLSQN
jgi:hypothetical protein